MFDAETHIRSFKLGSIERLKEIARLNIGIRSEAAKRVIEKRYLRSCKKYHNN